MQYRSALTHSYRTSGVVLRIVSECCVLGLLNPSNAYNLIIFPILIMSTDCPLPYVRVVAVLCKWISAGKVLWVCLIGPWLCQHTCLLDVSVVVVVEAICIWCIESFDLPNLHHLHDWPHARHTLVVQLSAIDLPYGEVR